MSTFWQNVLRTFNRGIQSRWDPEYSEIGRLIGAGSSMMVRLNNPRAFLAKLVASGELPLGPAAQNFSISVDGGRVISFENADGISTVGEAMKSRHHDLTRQQLTALLFGAHVQQVCEISEVPAWLHEALRWRGGLIVWRSDTS